MRKKVPSIGDERIITRFLFFPCRINGELRWFEKAKIRQEYDSMGFPFHSNWWNLCFEDDIVEKAYEEIYKSCNKKKNENL